MFVIKELGVERKNRTYGTEGEREQQLKQSRRE